MDYRFLIFVETSDPKIYKIPVQQTARLVNEYPDKKLALFEKLEEAKEAVLTMIGGAPVRAKSSISIFSSQSTSQNEELRKTVTELTEDRVERFHI